MLSANEKSKLRITHYCLFVRWIHRWPLDSPHNETAMQKAWLVYIYIYIYIYIYNLDSVQYFENIYGGYYHFWCWNRNIQGWQGGYHHWNGAVVMVTALIITGDVEGKLQRLQWISRLSPWRPFRFCDELLMPWLARTPAANHIVKWVFISHDREISQPLNFSV